jgi:hypothetical protein
MCLTVYWTSASECKSLFFLWLNATVARPPESAKNAHTVAHERPTAYCVSRGKFVRKCTYGDFRRVFVPAGATSIVAVTGIRTGGRHTESLQA